MSVGTYCKHRVITIEPDVDLSQAAERMREHHVGLLVVVSPNGRKPIGVLTDRDIVVQVLAKGILPALITVADAMTPDPLVACESDSLPSISERMRARGVRRVPVVNDHGELTGIIASDDLLDVAATILFNLSATAHKEQCTERRVRR